MSIQTDEPIFTLTQTVLLRDVFKNISKEERSKIRKYLIDLKNDTAVSIADNRIEWGSDIKVEKYDNIKSLIKKLDYVDSKTKKL